MSSFGYSQAEEIYRDASISFETIDHQLKFVKNESN